ncbi:MAG: hypothetical protein LBF55_04015, partial [Prevotellaceae bacterium]|nr:hypothetical protein [Prevotellaceae bacterium]
GKGISEILREELDTLLRDIIARHEAAGQVASGRTRDSFEVAVEGLHGSIMGYKWPGPVLETGRKGGKVPYGFKNIIREWIVAKGLRFTDEKQLDRWAAAIAWKIAREGTKLYRSGGHEDIFETPFEEFKERLAARIAVFYAAEAVNSVYDRLK